jgi:ElaB/YqjD/DUF883 family membrane-anchored ribosome-binding protein
MENEIKMQIVDIMRNLTWCAENLHEVLASQDPTKGKNNEKALINAEALLESSTQKMKNLIS